MLFDDALQVLAPRSPSHTQADALTVLLAGILTIWAAPPTAAPLDISALVPAWSSLQPHAHHRREAEPVSLGPLSSFQLQLYYLLKNPQHPLLPSFLPSLVRLVDWDVPHVAWWAHTKKKQP